MRTIYTNIFISVMGSFLICSPALSQNKDGAAAAPAQPQFSFGTTCPGISKYNECVDTCTTKPESKKCSIDDDDSNSVNAGTKTYNCCQTRCQSELPTMSKDCSLPGTLDQSSCKESYTAYIKSAGKCDGACSSKAQACINSTAAQDKLESSLPGGLMSQLSGFMNQNGGVGGASDINSKCQDIASAAKQDLACNTKQAKSDFDDATKAVQDYEANQISKQKEDQKTMQGLTDSLNQLNDALPQITQKLSEAINAGSNAAADQRQQLLDKVDKANLAIQKVTKDANSILKLQTELNIIYAECDSRAVKAWMAYNAVTSGNKNAGYSSFNNFHDQLNAAQQTAQGGKRQPQRTYIANEVQACLQDQTIQDRIKAANDEHQQDLDNAKMQVGSIQSDIKNLYALLTNLDQQLQRDTDLKNNAAKLQYLSIQKQIVLKTQAIQQFTQAQQAQTQQDAIKKQGLYQTLQQTTMLYQSYQRQGGNPTGCGSTKLLDAKTKQSADILTNYTEKEGARRAAQGACCSGTPATVSPLSGVPQNLCQDLSNKRSAPRRAVSGSRTLDGD